jgi:type I restriction enzyme R subunit
MVSRSTCRLFGCDFKLPTASYSLDRAVEEGYLVPYDVVKHTTKFLREGIKGHALNAEELVQLEEQGIDPNALDFESHEIDRAVFNKDSNRKVLQNLMNTGIRQADGQTLGKTIVFARNHRHAKLLEELFNDMYPQESAASRQAGSGLMCVAMGFVKQGQGQSDGACELFCVLK